MDLASLFFYCFATVLLFAAFRVVTTSNPVHAALYLVLAFTQASALWMLLQAEFLAIILIIVYVGAVMVLFLFVVMMMDIRLERTRALFWKNFPLAAVLGGLVAGQVIAVVATGFTVQEFAGVETARIANTNALGQMMYTEYLYAIQVAALILLVGMVAAIALTLRGARADNRAAQVSDQIAVTASERLLVVSDAMRAAQQHKPAEGKMS